MILSRQELVLLGAAPLWGVEAHAPSRTAAAP